jgi:type I restriction enzyme S subunit
MDSAAQVSEQTYLDRTVRAVPSHGDLLFSREGTYFGIAAEVPAGTKVCLGQRMVLLRPNPQVLDFQFLKYWLNSPIMVQHVRGFRDGSVAERLNVPTIRSLAIVLPPIDEQQSIAHSLSVLDQKIALNLCTNRTLESIARAVFKSRFFERTPHVGPLIKVGELTEIIKGRSYKSEELDETVDTALVTLKSFERGGGYKTDGLKGFSGPFKPEQEVKAGEIVIALTDVTQNAEVIGRPALVGRSAKFSKLVASLDTAIVRPRKIVGTYFLYCLFRTPEFVDHTYAHSTGTTVLHLGKDAIPSFAFPKPEERDASSFEHLVAPMFDHLNLNELENTNLVALREAILPKLMSGDVRLRHAEEIVGADA